MRRQEKTREDKIRQKKTKEDKRNKRRQEQTITTNNSFC